MQKNAGEDDLDHPDTSGSPILKIPKDNSPAKKRRKFARGCHAVSPVSVLCEST